MPVFRAAEGRDPQAERGTRLCDDERSRTSAVGRLSDGPPRRFMIDGRREPYRGEAMNRVGKFVMLCCLCALVVAGAGQSGTTASHRGGTLKLLAKSAGGTLDPHVNYTLEYWQLFQATYDGLLAFKKAGGNEAFTVVPDLAENLPTPTNGGKTWVFKLRKGIKFSNGAAPDGQRRRRLVPAHLQGEEPDLRELLRGHRRREGVPRQAGHVHAEGRRGRQCEGEHRDDQPDRAGLGVQVPPRRSAREHRPGELAAERRRHEADSRHGRVLLRLVRPEQAARDEAQPVLQGVVARRAARRLPGRDRSSPTA